MENIESVKDENQVLSGLHDYLFQLEESIKETNQSLLETERKLETCLKDQSLILASVNGSTYLVEKLNKLEDSVKQLEEDNFTKRDIVIQRRIDGSENFYRPWNDYKNGFGNSSGEFFIGLDVINKLTNSRPYELLVVMEDFDNDRRYAKYDQFIIGNEAEKYILKQLGKYSGSAGDALSYSLGQKFTTIDEDNDLSNNNCAVQYTGAWWYKSCHER